MYVGGLQFLRLLVLAGTTEAGAFSRQTRFERTDVA
jgi:hypothetical protein